MTAESFLSFIGKQIDIIIAFQMSHWMMTILMGALELVIVVWIISWIYSAYKCIRKEKEESQNESEEDYT